MNYFDNYTSNTLAGCGNQAYYVTENSEEFNTCRLYYKIYCEGEFEYSVLFSNILDSTFADGSHGVKNRVLKEWIIEKAKIGIANECTMESAGDVFGMTDITFDGKTRKTVHAGEFFYSDPVTLEFNRDQYLCVEFSFCGEEIPHHPESLVPSFVRKNNEWIPSVFHPYPGMIGCNRCVKRKIAFLGDSITQGIGTAPNSYTHWNAVLADMIGKDYSYWNMGIGFARADDAASDGAWLYKAKQNDIIFVCMGVNDICHGHTADNVISYLDTIVTKLKTLGKCVIVQTLPPFDYQPEIAKKWYRVNNFIKDKLKFKADMIFDNVEVLKKSDELPHMAAFGGHPNADGCRIWGERLGYAFKDFLKNK